MYVPSIYTFEDKNKILGFIQQYSFATIVTNKGDTPIATQLPFVIKESADKLILSAHFGSKNEQSKYIEDNTSLIIFSEPHAYISPSHYENTKNVPTWDYISVHAYGKASILREENEKLRALEEMILFYEKDYQNQWNQLPQKYIAELLKDIVAFKIDVHTLQAKQKLSQNRSPKEIENIARYLESSTKGTEQDLAKYIRAISRPKDSI